MHALGHALLALAAGMCARGIATASLGMDDRSMAFAVFPGPSHDLVTSAYFWAFLGALAAAAKLTGGTIASYLQSRMAGDIAAEVRLALLDAWLHTHDRTTGAARGLRRSRQRDQGYAVGATKLTQGVSNATRPSDSASHEPNSATDANHAIDAVQIAGMPSAATRGEDASEATDTIEAGAPASTLAAMIAEVREVQLGIERGLLASLRAVLQLVPLVIVLVVLAPRVAVGALLVFVPFGLLLGLLRRTWKRGHRQAAAEAARLLEVADDAVRHADLWTTFGAQAKARIHVARLGQIVAQRAARLEAAAAAMSGANELLAALLLLAVLALSHAGVIHLASAQLLPFVVTFFLAYRPLRELAEARIAWSRAESAYASFDLPAGEAANADVAFEQVDSSPNGQTARTVWPLAELSLQNVSPVHARILPITLTIAPGEIVVLAGRTGAGKTSLFRALLGLDPIEGTVLYNGTSLNDAAIGPDARPFVWGPQDAPLVGASLAANVQLGEDAADAEAVLADLGAAHLSKELTSDRLGSGGRALSGGERQWVSLARAVATRLPVLLLDEPTSGLDAAAQALVLQAIARLRGKRTVILVTHRSEPLAIADRVVRLEGDATRSVR